jgi:hypothetical protein
MASILDFKSIGHNQKTVLKKQVLIYTTKNKDQSIIQLKDSICFKLVQIGS